MRIHDTFGVARCSGRITGSSGSGLFNIGEFNNRLTIGNEVLVERPWLFKPCEPADITGNNDVFKTFKRIDLW